MRPSCPQRLARVKTRHRCGESPVPVELERQVDAEPLEERVVVADHEHGAPVRGERVDELVDRVEVEVVRRLVEHDELRRRIGEQHPRERDAEPLAARQRRDRTLHGRIRG